MMKCYMAMALALLQPVMALAISDRTIGTECAHINTGEAYLYGHKMDPPYRLSIMDSVLFLNDIQISPPLSDTIRRIELSPPSETVVARHALNARGGDLIKRMHEQHASAATIADALTALYRSSLLVDSVYDVTSSGFWVRWKGDPHAEQLSIPVQERTETPPLLALERELESICAVLSQGAMIIYSTGEVHTIPATAVDELGRARADIRVASTADTASLSSENWVGRTFSWRMARLFRHPLALPSAKEK